MYHVTLDPAEPRRAAGHARAPPELHCGSALRSSGVAFDTADDFSSCVAFDISSVGAVHCDEVPAAEG